MDKMDKTERDELLDEVAQGAIYIGLNSEDTRDAVLYCEQLIKNNNLCLSQNGVSP